MSEKREVVMCAPVRTAIGTFNGSLKDVPATEIGGAAIQESLRRTGLNPLKIGSVTMGNVIQAGNKMNPARQAAMFADIPVSVPALTVNRVCGSGAQAIVSAAQEVLLGLTDAAIAGGMENMDRAPYLIPGARWGQRMGHGEIYDSMLRDGLVDAFSDEHSGWHTEDLVKQENISREDQDRWAERSQTLFARGQEAGYFDDEIVSISVPGRKGPIEFSRDEHPRGTTLEALSKLRPAFRKDGTITAGNAPGLNSAGAAMVLAERAFAEKNGIEPFARLVSWGVSAVEPGMFGLGPVPAVHQAVDRAGWKLRDVDRLEINEAFAAVPLAALRRLNLPEDVVNVDGGAIAHGHAIGATGAILATRLLYSMRRDGQRRGIVALCIGGGQGIALAFERI